MTLRLNGSTSGYVELDAPAVAGTSALTLPTGTGTIAKTVDSGLQLITTQSISSVASVSINGCFTSTYDAYRILWIGSSSSDYNLRIRLRASGIDSSGSTEYTYGALYINVAGTIASLFSSSGANSGFISQPPTTAHYVSIEVIKPASSVRTVMQTSGSVGFGSFGFITHTPANAYDGFTLLPDQGNITGNLYVYGYRKS